MLLVPLGAPIPAIAIADLSPVTLAEVQQLTLVEQADLVAGPAGRSLLFWLFWDCLAALGLWLAVAFATAR